MRRRALLASAAILPTIGIAGCLGRFAGSNVEITRHEDPGYAPTPGVPLTLLEDATLAAAWSVGEPSDGDPKPVHVAVANVAPNPRECPVTLAVNGTDRFDARPSLDTDEYAQLTLYAPRNYVATVGRRPDREALAVDRSDFDCNERSVTAEVAADGTVETGGATTDMGCGPL
jgi:hypothetical protein